MSNLTGQSLGRYHILEQLGEGGMAVVYKAYDTRLETDVAVKVIRTENLAPSILENTLKRFEREAKSLAKLTHTHIVKVTDYGEHEGKPYLVMPYLPGGTLKELLKHGAIAWEDTVQLLLPIARALEYAHKQNLIHRDVKPSNILLTESGQPMLTDFGVAKLFDMDATADLTGTGMGIGTPEYMAPEQWIGQVGPQSDVYALGLVLYEMVTGRKPYVADTPAALILKQANDPLPRPRDLRANLPEAVEKVALKALAKTMGDRYKDMGLFADALERLLKHKDAELTAQTRTAVATDMTVTSIQPQEPVREAAPQKSGGRKMPWLLAAGAAFGCCVLAVAGIAVWQLFLSPPATPTSVPIPIPPITEITDTPSVPMPHPGITDITITPTEAATDTPVVASSWQQGKLVFLTSDNTIPNSIHWLNFAKENEAQLLYAPENPSSSYLLAPWLSLDGKSLVYGNYYDTTIFSLNLDPIGSPRLIGMCQGPTVSPDGNHVICHVEDQKYFPVYDIHTGELVDRIVHGKDGAVWPAWSPDGTEIAFSVLESKEFAASVWKVSVSGGKTIRLAVQANEDYAPSWSPDSEWIAFQSNLTSEKSEIWIMRRDGSERQQITWSGEGNWSRGPCFSPDGQWLAFVSTQNGSIGADFGEVFIVSLITGKIHQITHTSGHVYDWRVTWGP
jgi:serine/threonine protein kinase